MRSRITPFAPAIAWAVLVLLVSSWPRLTVPEFGDAPVDKIAHFIEYFTLGILLNRGDQKHHTFGPLLLGTLGIVFSALDESHQAFIPGRMPSLSDFVADALGVIAGVTGHSIVLSRR